MGDSQSIAEAADSFLDTDAVVFAANPLDESPPGEVVDRIQNRLGHRLPEVVRPSPHHAVGEGVVATLGSLTDLLQVCELVTGLSQREPREQGQAAGMSPCKEDSRAACPTQSDTRSDPSPAQPPSVRRPWWSDCPPSGRGGDDVAGEGDRQTRRSPAGTEEARDE